MRAMISPKITSPYEDHSRLNLKSLPNNHRWFLPPSSHPTSGESPLTGACGVSTPKGSRIGGSQSKQQHRCSWNFYNDNKWLHSCFFFNLLPGCWSKWNHKKEEKSVRERWVWTSVSIRKMLMKSQLKSFSPQKNREGSSNHGFWIKQILASNWASCVTMSMCFSSSDSHYKCKIRGNVHLAEESDEILRHLENSWRQALKFSRYEFESWL